MSNQTLRIGGIPFRIVSHDDGTATLAVASGGGGNFSNKFREAFEAYLPGERWAEALGSGDIITLDGNSAGASYLVISKSPLFSGTVSTLTSIVSFDMPFELAVGLGTSQRTLGQEFSLEAISGELPLPTPTDLAIASITQATTTLTVNTTLPHNLRPGMRIGIRNVSDSRLNYPALVVASTPTATQFTVTAGPAGAIPSVSAGPFTSGFVFFRSALGFAPNGTSMILENATATNASFYVRSEAGDALPSGTIIGSHAITTLSTVSLQAINAAGAYAFQPTNEFRLSQFVDGLQWSDAVVDTLAAANNRHKRTQVVPDPSALYHVRIRATNNASLTTPNAQIVSAVKTGTTTATITTDVPHGLTTTDQVVIYGIRAQGAAEFPNLLTATAVASVVNATTFTVVIGTAGTVTSYGGYVARVDGGNLMSALGANAVIAQSIVRTGNILTVTGNTNWAGLVIGDYVNLVGCRDNVTGASLNIDGAYRVHNVATTALTLEPINATVSPTGADIISTNCGGGVIKRTDLRLSFVRVLEFERERVEIMPRPTGDISSAAPVTIHNTPAITGTVTATLGAGTAVAGAVATAIPLLVADIASAALVTSTTVAAITPSYGVSYEVNIAVTAASGAGATLDVGIEESDDSGTNWFRVYDFPRITGAGAVHRSPKLPLTGNRIRYTQTVGGTSPSFTRVVNRLQSTDAIKPFRQLIDRSIVLTTLNSTTPSLIVAQCENVQMVVNIGTATTPPALQLEGSDDNGVTWYALGAPLTAVASATVQVTVPDTSPGLIRARVSTAGATVVAGSITLKGY
jgi:hypothetical protein